MVQLEASAVEEAEVEGGLGKGAGGWRRGEGGRRGEGEGSNVHSCQLHSNWSRPASPGD